MAATITEGKKSGLQLSAQAGDGAGLVRASQFGAQDVVQNQRKGINLAAINARIGQLAQILLSMSKIEGNHLISICF